MIWTAWNNGKKHYTGAGYGFKIRQSDRNQYFSRSWPTVIIELPANSGESTILVEVNINKESFWVGAVS